MFLYRAIVLVFRCLSRASARIHACCACQCKVTSAMAGPVKRDGRLATSTRVQAAEDLFGAVQLSAWYTHIS